MIELTQTDFPEPVAPAMSRCGVCARSRTCGFPVTSFPRATGIAILAASGKSVSISSRKLTIERFLLGTSMPTACFPGMGATIRTLEAARRNAILSCRLVIFDSLMPGEGSISNIVTTGPLRIPVMDTSILNSLKVDFSISAARLVASSTIQYSPSG